MSATLQQLKEQITSKDNATVRYLAFTLGGNQYAIRRKEVELISAWSLIVPVPGMPRFVPGVINHDKDRIPVIDMRHLLKLTPVPFCPSTAVIVVKARRDSGRSRVGLLVDAITGHREIPNSDISQPQNLAVMAKTNSVSGLATLNGENIILLDIDRLTSSSGALQTVDSL